MKKEQKSLLYNILRTDVQMFYLACKDFWSSADYAKNTELNQKYDSLKKEYNTKYGDLPELQYHEDVVKLMQDLEKDIDL